MSLDHGLLNLPLSKRDIEKAIDDALKDLADGAAGTERRAKEARRLAAADYRRAIELIDGLSNERVAELATSVAVPHRSVRKLLRERAKLCPAVVRRALESDKCKAACEVDRG